MTISSTAPKGAFFMFRRTMIVGLLAVPLITGAADAGDTSDKVNALPNGVAMDGFDVVAYFDGAPAHGTEAHTVAHKGKTWRFSSAENAAKFKADPAKFEPQFHGYCSYAVAEGYGAEVDFVNGWVVLDDKLYLNWNEATKDAFVANQSTLVESAYSNWDGVHAGLKDGTTPLYTHADEGVDIPHPQPLN